MQARARAREQAQRTSGEVGGDQVKLIAAPPLHESPEREEEEDCARLAQPFFSGNRSFSLTLRMVTWDSAHGVQCVVGGGTDTPIAFLLSLKSFFLSIRRGPPLVLSQRILHARSMRREGERERERERIPSPSLSLLLLASTLFPLSLVEPPSSSSF